MQLTKYVERPRLLLELKTPNVLDSFPICTLFLFFILCLLWKYIAVKCVKLPLEEDGSRPACWFLPTYTYVCTRSQVRNTFHHFRMNPRGFVRKISGRPLCHLRTPTMENRGILQIRVSYHVTYRIFLLCIDRFELCRYMQTYKLQMMWSS